MKEYAAHPFSEIFPFHEDSIAPLSDNIKIYGQKEDIVLLGNQILDGRRRLAACIRAKVKPRFRKFGSRATDGDDPLEFVFAVNYHRRDLTVPERAVAAVAYANLRKGYNPNPANAGLSEKPISQEEAADKLGTSKAMVERAKRVMDHGIPELQEAMKAEKVSISDAAAIAGEPADIQREAVRRVLAKPKEATTLQAAVEAMKPPPPECPKRFVQDLGILVERAPRIETQKLQARDMMVQTLQSVLAVAQRL